MRSLSDATLFRLVGRLDDRNLLEGTPNAFTLCAFGINFLGSLFILQFLFQSIRRLVVGTLCVFGIK